LDQPGFSATVPGEVIRDRKIFELSGLGGFAERWFERGRLLVESGAAAGLVGIIKNDRMSGNGRVIELWEDLRAEVVAGDMLRLEAGCDKRVETCKLKFSNFLNYRGFPHIPGEDWLISVPRQDAVNNGGSLGA
ncbi:MAG: phage BR0599 family protein, partial [Paracoccaceae bacterium]